MITSWCVYLCCKTVDVKKTMDYLEKIRSIDQSINQAIDQSITLFHKIIDQSINHQLGFIDDWGWKREERIRSEVQKRCGYLVGRVEMDR